MRRVYFDKQQASRGDKLHAYAQQAIELGVRQADNGTTLSTYINDAIGFRMSAEVPLTYSLVCFGTADACGFREEVIDGYRGLVLRVSDLKTGLHLADMRQLLIYAAIFCFEYGFTPDQITIILRIYQNDGIVELIPDAPEMYSVMSRIKAMSDLVMQLREED